MKKLPKTKDDFAKINMMEEKMKALDDLVLYGSCVVPANCSFGGIAITPECYPTPPVPQEKGNNPMYANVANAAITVPPTEVQDQRKYLERRLEAMYYEKKEPLWADFGLEDMPAPRGPEAFKKAIADGKFQIRGIDFDQEHAARYDGWYWTDLIVFRDPAVKPDRDGFDAAIKDLKELRQKTLDIIKIDEPKAGLDALKAFEAWEPKGAAN